VAVIAASTVVCGYHYPLDAVAGLVTGGACLAVVLRLERSAATGSG
jgi:membrane-associated phospholipid phosphatase